MTLAKPNRVTHAAGSVDSAKQLQTHGKQASALAHRSLGRTGAQVSAIGFGAFMIGRNEGTKYPEAYDVPDLETLERLLNTVLDSGINYIDTAPAYGCSEERIGQTIAHRRHEFLVSTKVGEEFVGGRSIFRFSTKDVRASVHRSLRRLRTDVLDVVFVHSSGQDVQILTQTDVIETLRTLRDEGHVRWIGLSGKTVEGARMPMKWADVIMVQYNVNNRTHEQVIAEAGQAGLGVIVKKGLASGRLRPQDAIPFVLANPNVSSLMVGMLKPQHVESNVAIAACVSTSRRR